MADDTRQLEDILRTLSEDQLRFVAERLSCRTDAEAADKCGFPHRTVYGWDNKQDVNDAVRLAQLDGLNVARERLRRMAGKALTVLDAEMDGKHRNAKRYEAALAVLDRVGLAAVQRVEQKTENSGEMVIRVEYADSNDNAAQTAPSASADQA